MYTEPYTSTYICFICTYEDKQFALMTNYISRSYLFFLSLDIIIKLQISTMRLGRRRLEGGTQFARGQPGNVIRTKFVYRQIKPASFSVKSTSISLFINNKQALVKILPQFRNFVVDTRGFRNQSLPSSHFLGQLIFEKVSLMFQTLNSFFEDFIPGSLVSFQLPKKIREIYSSNLTV